jgi:hypothetical protein
VLPCILLAQKTCDGNDFGEQHRPEYLEVFNGSYRI